MMITNKKRKVAIIGAGTAGLMIAKNINEICDVTVFEKSKYKMPYIYRVPLLIGHLFKKELKYIKKINFQNKFQKAIPFFTPNVIGGASMINGCVHVLGIKKEIILFFEKYGFSKKQIEQSISKIYGSSKPLINVRKSFVDNLDHDLYKTLKEVGFVKSDTSWNEKNTYGTIKNTIGKYFRSTISDSVKNVKISNDCEIKHLIINSNNEICGLLLENKEFYFDDVILCAGVIGSTSLLQKGLYCKDRKQVFNIKESNKFEIQDHSNLRINIKSERDILSLNVLENNLVSKIKELYKFITLQPSIMTGSGATSTMHVETDMSNNLISRINLLRFYESGRASSNTDKYFNSSETGFSFSITLINPSSKGYIFDEKVYPNYCSDKIDIEQMKSSINFVMSLLKKEPLKSYVSSIEQEEQILSNIEKYIQDNTYSGYHLINGCSDLIDNDFSLKGYRNLYICDASIFDSYVSSNINASILILADLFSNQYIRNTNEI